ncbi:MAG TPA: hypothetical protein VGA99_15565, partial [bacterium]
NTKTGGMSQLITIDTATGIGTAVHPTNTIGFHQLEALEFSPDGRLFGFSETAAKFVQIDPATGIGREFTTVTGTKLDIEGLAFTTPKR